MITNYLIQLQEESGINFYTIAQFSNEPELSGFKLKMDNTQLPKRITKALSIVTQPKNLRFYGKPTRLRFLPSDVLSITSINKLKGLLETYNVWVDEHLARKSSDVDEYIKVLYDFSPEVLIFPHNVQEYLKLRGNDNK